MHPISDFDERLYIENIEQNPRSSEAWGFAVGGRSRWVTMKAQEKNNWALVSSSSWQSGQVGRIVRMKEWIRCLVGRWSSSSFHRKTLGIEGRYHNLSNGRWGPGSGGWRTCIRLLLSSGLLANFPSSKFLPFPSQGNSKDSFHPLIISKGL